MTTTPTTEKRYDIMSKFTDYLLLRIDVRLNENFEMILATTGMAKAYWLLKRVDILRLQERTIKSIDTHNESKYVYTDSHGSFWNKDTAQGSLIY